MEKTLEEEIFEIAYQKIATGEWEIIPDSEGLVRVNPHFKFDSCCMVHEPVLPGFEKSLHHSTDLDLLGLPEQNHLDLDLYIDQ